MEHRKATVNRVSENEVHLAGIKSQINKLKTYQLKLETQVEERTDKTRELAREGNKKRALIHLRHKIFLEKESKKVDGAM